MPSERAASQPVHPRTPDGRYFVVRGRLWRLSDPALAAEQRHGLVSDLMAARRALRDANGDDEARTAARQRIDATKRALGERGPPWWNDGAPDYNRHLVRTTPYAAWYETLGGNGAVAGLASPRPNRYPERDPSSA